MDVVTKVIIIDVETILLNDDGQIMLVTKDLFAKAKAAAIAIILVTKNDLLPIIVNLKILKILQYVTYIICFNGAVIYDLKKRMNIWNIHLNQNETSYIYEIIKKYQLSFYAYGITKNIYYYKDIINNMQLLNVGYKLKLLNPQENILESYLIVINKEEIVKEALKKIMIEIETNQNLQLSDEIFNKIPALIIGPRKVSPMEAIKFILNKWELNFKNCLILGISLNEMSNIKSSRSDMQIKNEYLDLLKVIKK